MMISCSAYLSMSEAASVASSNFAPYDQYEVSIPMEIAGDCLHTVSTLCASTSIYQHAATCKITHDGVVTGTATVVGRSTKMLCLCSIRLR